MGAALIQVKLAFVPILLFVSNNNNNKKKNMFKPLTIARVGHSVIVYHCMLSANVSRT